MDPEWDVEGTGKREDITFPTDLPTESANAGCALLSSPVSHVNQRPFSHAVGVVHVKSG
jgi:hypothetical protein